MITLSDFNQTDNIQDITHIRFYFPLINDLRRALTDEQMGRLFFAVADYAQTGEPQNVSGDIIFPYNECIRSVNNARQRMGI